MKLTGLVALVVLVAAQAARADEPWEHDVAKSKRDQAQALFAEGNALFAREAHQPALEKYKAAIALWDHPLIRFNMAVTRIRLDRILEAADDLDSALRFGERPFTPELYRQALDYQKLVAGRVGTVEASCDQGDAQIMLDGKPWFACPATKKQRVLAGEHVLVGEKAGYLTYSRRLVVSGTVTVTENVRLVPLSDVVHYEYPLQRWIPWAVGGAGTAVGFGGLAFWFAGRSQMDQFEADFARLCPTGCQADLSDQPQLARDRDSAELKGTIAIGMMVGGGAIAIGGLVWGGLINRPRRVVPNMELQPTSGGVTAKLGWRF